MALIFFYKYVCFLLSSSQLPRIDLSYSLTDTYGKVSFICYIREGVSLTTLNRFLKDLEPLVCGEHFSRFLHQVNDDIVFSYRCNNDPHFLGTLKKGLYPNDDGAFDSVRT